MEVQCKNCRWSGVMENSSEHVVTFGRKRLQCQWEEYNKLPISISHTSTFMYEDEGKCCPCFEEK